MVNQCVLLTMGFDSSEPPMQFHSTINDRLYSSPKWHCSRISCGLTPALDRQGVKVFVAIQRMTRACWDRKASVMLHILRRYWNYLNPCLFCDSLYCCLCRIACTFHKISNSWTTFARALALLDGLPFMHCITKCISGSRVLCYAKSERCGRWQW